jgi:Putative sensor
MIRLLTAPIRERQTYRNLTYLALAFPLGLVEFSFLVVGLALGLGLLITWIGLAVLLATLAGAFVLARLESSLSARLLRAEPGVRCDEPGAGSIPTRLLAYLQRRSTWTTLAYLAAKLPLGLATFAVTITALGVALSLALAAVSYPFGGGGELGGWDVDTPAEALAAGLAGAAALPLALHVLNGVAALWGRFSRAMLPAVA